MLTPSPKHLRDMPSQIHRGEVSTVMPCNLAVAITKAALTDERFKALIDEHIDQVIAIMESQHFNPAKSPSKEAAIQGDDDAYEFQEMH
jgi:hypothetical protein